LEQRSNHVNYREVSPPPDTVALLAEVIADSRGMDQRRPWKPITPHHLFEAERRYRQRPAC